MDEIKYGTNCQTCIDCQRMVGGGISWRCYGRENWGEIRRDICEGEQPPNNAPDWCPRTELKESKIMVTEKTNKSLIKVRYFIMCDELSSREYTYYSEEALQVGDIVTVPIRDTTCKAQVTTIDVPETEVAAFRDKVKTIPSGSVMAQDFPIDLPFIGNIRTTPKAEIPQNKIMTTNAHDANPEPQTTALTTVNPSDVCLGFPRHETWRPEGWVNPYPKHTHEYSDYERGADAMFEKLFHALNEVRMLIIY